MSARTMPTIPLALALALAVACDDNPVAPAHPPPDPNEALSEDESVALFRGITRLTLADASALHPGTVMIECPRGGHVEVVETIEGFQADGNSPEMDVAYTITPASCRIRSQGYLFVVDGKPSLRTELHLAIGMLGFQEVAYVTGTIDGELGWQLHNRSGSCAIEGTVDSWGSLVPDPDSHGSGYFAGSVCGYSVKIDTSALLQLPPFPS